MQPASQVSGPYNQRELVCRTAGEHLTQILLSKINCTGMQFKGRKSAGRHSESQGLSLVLIDLLEVFAVHPSQLFAGPPGLSELMLDDGSNTTAMCKHMFALGSKST